MINFITNLPLTLTSGGWGGISANIYEQLSARDQVNFVGPIDPPYPITRKATSKLRRSMGLRGKFTLFDRDRLDKIATTYLASRNSKADFEVFHGATPWVHCKPPARYGAYIDATFTMYLDIYSNTDSFLPSDIGRIAKAEGAWMHNASILFFGSNWVKEHAVKEFDLPADKCHVIWVGGNVPLPKHDRFSSGYQFLFISLNFEKKGGRIAVEALQKVREQIPAAELIIIGERPPNDVEAMDGVTYGGFLRKDNPKELSQLCQHLATARALVHPTSMDTMGIVLIEAGYYGCPSIATKQFGIPELVIDDNTGILLDTPITVSQLSESMLRLCQDGLAYNEMRRAARAHTTKVLTWEAFGSSMHRSISRALLSA